MAIIFQTTFTNGIPWLKIVFYFQFHWILFPWGPNDNKSALVRVMAWCRTGDEPLPEPIFTNITDDPSGWHWKGEYYLNSPQRRQAHVFLIGHYTDTVKYLPMTQHITVTS